MRESKCEIEIEEKSECSFIALALHSHSDFVLPTGLFSEPFLRDLELNIEPITQAVPS